MGRQPSICRRVIQCSHDDRIKYFDCFVIIVCWKHFMSRKKNLTLFLHKYILRNIIVETLRRTSTIVYLLKRGNGWCEFPKMQLEPAFQFAITALAGKCARFITVTQSSGMSAYCYYTRLQKGWYHQTSVPYTGYEDFLWGQAPRPGL